MRADRDEEAWGNHVALLVTVDDEVWLADVGIGDAFLEPLPLREGVLSTIEEFAEVLADVFRIPLADHGPDGLATLWARIGTQHEAWEGMQARAAR